MKRFTTRDESTGVVEKEYTSLGLVEVLDYNDLCREMVAVIKNMPVGAKVFFNGITIERTV